MIEFQLNRLSTSEKQKLKYLGSRDIEKTFFRYLSSSICKVVEGKKTR